MRLVRGAGRLFVCTVAALGCAAAPLRADSDRANPTSVAEQDTRRAARALADRFVASYFARFPEDATTAGYPGADLAAVPDNSLAAWAAWRAEEDRFLAEAKALASPPPGSPERAALATVVEQLEASVAMRACRTELWGVSTQGGIPGAYPLVGWQSRLTELAEVQPVGTAALRAAAVARLEARPAWVLTEVENLRMGMRLGFTASHANVEAVVGQLDALLRLPPGAWPTLAPAERDPDPGFRQALERATAALLPAARAYRDFLSETYLPAARKEAGVGAFPGAGTCYRAAIRAGTTLERPADELHALGLAELERVRAEMLEITRRDFGSEDVEGLLARLGMAAGDPSPAATLERVRAAVARARAAMPRAFERLPRGNIEVRPYPEAEARSGAADSSIGGLVGDQYQGLYRINTFAPLGGRLGAESTAFHETYPGHFLQGALAVEAAGRPDSRFLASNAPSEGWALYAERLADELGLFSSDASRLGMLQQQAFRSARLVVDTGLHAKGWSRQQAAEFLGRATGRPASEELDEVDRYCAWPGQALGYMVGALEIRALRREAEQALGARFDLRRFHAVLLSDGGVPLRVLREKVEMWMATER